MKFHFFVFIFMVFSMSGCKGDDNPEPAIEKVTLSLSTKTVSALPGEHFTVTVKLNDASFLEKLKVVKRNAQGEHLYKTLFPADFKENGYTFEYSVTEEDKDDFEFIFEAYNRAGELTNMQRLQVTPEYPSITLSNLRKIARVTGKSLPGETLPNPNRTDERYDVCGTDLGIIWAMDGDKAGIFFGDTFGKDFVPSTGGGGNGSNWRSNVLAFSSDTNLDDDLTFSGMATDQWGNAREIAYSAKNTSGTGDYSSIPTSAIRANGIDYLHYMNVRTWTSPKGWDTNFSSLYSSGDDGKTWQREERVIFPSNSVFAQIGYAKKDGYIYMIGTQSGRKSAAYLARFAEKDILNMGKYEYWNNTGGWVLGNEQSATILFEATVGELSVIYHRKYHRWIAAYFDDQAYAIMYRDAANITGPWSPERILASGSLYPILYGSFIHPLKDKEDHLYFLMSQWQPYNVFLMRADIGY